MQKYKKPLVQDMLAKDLISNSIPVIKTSDNGEDALILMEEFKIAHVPVVDNAEYVGLISETDIFEMKNPEMEISKELDSLSKPFVDDQAHLYDAAELISRLKISVVPVVNGDQEYLGAIANVRIAYELADFFAIDGPGGIIELHMKEVSYSMNEIARIVEDDGAKILSSSVKVDNNSRMYSVTLKLNLEDITPVIKAFERYGYHIENYFMNNGKLDTVLQERYDMLVRYLDV